MTKQMDISIIIPCYNEEKAIGVVLDSIQQVMQKEKYSYEVIVVDDASTDNTYKIAQTKDIKAIKKTSRGGSGAARKTGILNASGKIIVMLDGDGSYEAADIPKLLAYFPEYDQVNGARTSEQGSLRYLRSPVKWFINKLACYLTGTRIPDLNTGFKAFKKDIMLDYLWVLPDGFSCVTSITLAFLCNGYSVKYIPTAYYPRIGKSKFHPLIDVNKYILTVLRIVTYFNPLKVFLPMSFILFIFGVLKSFYDYVFLIRRLQLSDIIIILSALIIFMLGLLADLIVAQSKVNVFVNKYNSNKHCG
jgi:glycosyltransferase involved in cell wall biosynthesis